LKAAISIALLAVLFSRVDAGQLQAAAGHASARWLAVALLVHVAGILASTWRWRLLLDAQGIHMPARALLSSYLVAGFFNNFLPSNIGGDVVRIRDTARAAQSKTVAATIVLVDRGLGLIGLMLVAAAGATFAASAPGGGPGRIAASWLWAAFAAGAAAAAWALTATSAIGRLLGPLTLLHPQWIGERIEKLTAALVRFRARPDALAGCFTGAVAVQALLVAYYLAVAFALHLPLTVWDLAVIVPASFIVQMLPISVNGFGVREAVFSFYFTRRGLPIESALLLSLMATGLTMLFSLSGAALYVSRSHRRPPRTLEAA
jgi:uncharacterized membrane protein YbhN (UPF0104 family)